MTMHVLAYVIVCLAGLFLCDVMCATGTDARNLRTQLFVTNGYDYKVRSATNMSDPTGIYFDRYIVYSHEWIFCSLTRKCLMNTVP